MSTLKIEITRENCPQCDGPSTLLSILFESVWSRCTLCGLDFMSGHLIKESTQEKRYATKI